MNILIGHKSYIIYQISLKSNLIGVKCFITTFQRVSKIQINWHTKGNGIKTIVTLNGKFPFHTTINGVNYQSDNINSVIDLVQKHTKQT